MKKWLKIILLPLLAIFLVACNQKPKETKVENAPKETTETTVAESNADKNESKEETQEDQSTEGEKKESDSSKENTANGEKGTASIIIYKDGEVNEEYKVNNIGGVSVMDAMEAAEGLDFNFSEADGVIDTIQGTTNDYNPNTWIYLYNGSYAELGVVSQKLKDGDEISWYFGTVNDLPVNIVPIEE